MELIHKAYGDAALSWTTIFEWHKWFWERRESVKGDELSGRPTTSRTNDNMAIVNKMVKEDRNVTYWLLVDTLGIPKNVVLQIWREDLKKRKMCSRFVPHALTWEQQKFDSFWLKNKSQHWTIPHTCHICVPLTTSCSWRWSCSWRVQDLIQLKRFRKPWPTI